MKVLDEEYIKSHLTNQRNVQVLDSVDSTNNYLKKMKKNEKNEKSSQSYPRICDGLIRNVGMYDSLFFCD